MAKASVKSKEIKAEVAEQPIVEEKATVTQPEGLKWDGNNNLKKVGVKTKCIVIDKYNRWHENVPIDLQGRDTSEYTWNYYGSQFPVLVQVKDMLIPYIHADAVGESSSRLWKAANPEGFRNTFKHTNSMLQKIQIGLMVALVLGILFLIFILINQ